jgi:hypothetical protein
MSVMAFEGPAGAGKTHRLMDELCVALAARQLASHERVLALTFMNGSRRRLDARLSAIAALGGQYEATTLDSFALRLVQRWRRLARHLGHPIPGDQDYNGVCALAAVLLEREAVRSWVTLSYPFVLVDEAQDLSRERSGMIAALEQSGSLLLAFDEFQCLNTALLPIAIEDWLRDRCAPVSLEGCRRTNDAELIGAALAVRQARAVARNGRLFKVICTPGQPNFAATCLANAIAWRRGGNVAVLTPSRRGGFADGAVALVCQRALGRHNNGPYAIEWEGSDRDDCAALWDRLGIGARVSVADAINTLGSHQDEPAFRTLRDWLVRQRAARSLHELAPEELRLQLSRVLALRRRHGYRRQAEFTAMTIQQAKNREFDHVVVLWPYTVVNDGEQRRRLLYNAITRAKRSCTVLVQSQELLNAPPFVPPRNEA